MNASDKIYVAGHRGMVGSAVCRALAKQGYTNVVTRTHKELDLLDPAAVRAFYEAEKPDVAVIAAARVGGIGANSAANALFLYENEMIALNTVWGAYKAGVKTIPTTVASSIPENVVIPIARRLAAPAPSAITSGNTPNRKLHAVISTAR